ncbi:MAG TPA: hypothetical protein VM032_15375 [Vicinamibacterales bacterium]|nr:hypothetical protein [Vicinamibacterales bacterium]
MSKLRSRIITAACAMVLGTGAGVAAPNAQSSKDVEAKRPKIRVRAQPQVVMAPARVTITAELIGGADDFEEYYCPAVEWEWGDDTSSESTTDCDPYESGKSQIKRRYTVQHQFRRAGSYKLYFHLKAKDHILGSGTTTLQVQPGAGLGPDGLQ